jgi:hypothetical protein
MTNDDFPGGRKGGCQDGGGGGNGGWADAPTEREPSTAIFLFFKMSPVIGGGRGGRGGLERESRGRRGLKEGGGIISRRVTSG